jgi:hypothetical protein
MAAPQTRMNPSPRAERRFTIVVCAIGFLLSFLTSRPIDSANYIGWVFAAFWVSGVWVFLLLSQLTTIGAATRKALAVGAAALLVFELYAAVAFGDPFFLAFKWIYHLAILATVMALVFVGLWIRKRLERRRENAVGPPESS